MLYVAYVQGGRELTFMEQLRLNGVRAYVPRQMAAERHHGEWIYVERIMFTRYVFVEAEAITPEFWQKVRTCTGFMRFLSNCALAPTEEEYIRLLCNNGDCIDVSRGYISNGALHITDGLLKQIEHKITRFNRRGKRATADVTLYGEHYKVVLSVEFDNPPVLP